MQQYVILQHILLPNHQSNNNNNFSFLISNSDAPTVLEKSNGPKMRSRIK